MQGAPYQELGFLEELSQRYEDPFVRMTFVPHFRFELFGRRFLAKGKLPQRSLCFGRQALATQTLDQLDRQVLADFDKHEFESIRASAKRLGEPLATVARRIQQLKTRGILCGFFLAPPIGFFDHVAYRILLSWKTLSTNLRQKVSQLCKQEHSIVFVTETLGAWSFELGVELASPRELPALLEKIDSNLGTQVIEITLLSELEDIKWRFCEFLSFER